MAQIGVNQGARVVGTLTTEGRRIRDVEPMLMQLEPDAGPLTTLLSRLGADTATDPKVEWFEDQLLPDFDTLGAILNIGDVSMTVNNYKFFRSGDIVRINDNEQVRVTTTPTSPVVAITRAYGAAAVAAPLGARLWIVSDAGVEFGTNRDGLSTLKQNVYNYIHLMQTPCIFSLQEINTDTFAGKDLPAEHQKAYIEHKKKLEKQLLVGLAYEDLVSNAPDAIRTFAGLGSLIKTNIKDVSAGFTEAELESFLRVVFRYGSKERLVLGSPAFMQALSAFARSKIQTRSSETSYGLTLMQYKCFFGTVLMANEVLLNNFDLNDLSGVGGWAFFIDINKIKFAYQQNMGMKMVEEIQLPAQMGRIDEVRSWSTLKLFNEQAHGLITGAGQA